MGMPQPRPMPMPEPEPMREPPPRPPRAPVRPPGRPSGGGGGGGGAPPPAGQRDPDDPQRECDVVFRYSHSDQWATVDLFPLLSGLEIMVAAASVLALGNYRIDHILPGLQGADAEYVKLVGARLRRRDQLYSEMSPTDRAEFIAAVMDATRLARVYRASVSTTLVPGLRIGHVESGSLILAALVIGIPVGIAVLGKLFLRQAQVDEFNEAKLREQNTRNRMLEQFERDIKGGKATPEQIEIVKQILSTAPAIVLPSGGNLNLGINLK
jgi:hypothetical protein